MKGFLNDLYLRPSCNACPSKCFKSRSDITIGDYWGIERILPQYDDDKGVSLVMIQTNNGLKTYQSIDADSIETSYENAFACNPAIEKSAKAHKKRKMFFERIDNNKKSIFASIEKSLQKSIASRIMDLIKKMLK
jgi:hypothetical protein